MYCLWDKLFHKLHKDTGLLRDILYDEINYTVSWIWKNISYISFAILMPVICINRFTRLERNQQNHRNSVKLVGKIFYQIQMLMLIDCRLTLNHIWQPVFKGFYQRIAMKWLALHVNIECTAFLFHQVGVRKFKKCKSVGAAHHRL